jgi:F-type H+-transporting ATPase subunit a
MDSTEQKTPTPEDQNTSTPGVPDAPSPEAAESSVPEVVAAEVEVAEQPVVETVAEPPPDTDVVGHEAPPVPVPAPLAPPVMPPPPPANRNFFERLIGGVQAWFQANPTRGWITIGIIGLLLLSILMKYLVEVPQPHVSLAGQPILQNGPSWFTNSLFTTLVVDVILIVLALLTVRKLELIPSGLQNFMEMVLEFIYGLAESIAGKAAAIYFPWAATLFLFIIISNYSGLIPFVGSLGFYHEAPVEEHGLSADRQLAMVNGHLMLSPAVAEEEHHEELVPLFRAPTADLSTTFALSLATMFMVQYHGVRTLGGRYWRKFAFWSPTGEGYMKGINGFVIFLELISELSRILTFAFRLFGNIFAGEVVLAVISFLVAFLVPLPFYALELLVGAIQALVFMMLALIFFNMATISHEHADEHH